jgi:hypothetical protein
MTARTTWLTLVIVAAMFAGTSVAPARTGSGRITRIGAVQYAPTPTSSTPVAGSPVARGVNPVILFLIDKSGSMSYDPLGGATKLALEKGTVRRAVTTLPAGTTLASGADREAILAAIDGITADGGSELLDALRTAFEALRVEQNATVKQVVLMSDGKSRGGDEPTYRKLIGAAVADGITLDTIAFGDDADAATMQVLAEIGHGRYSLVVTNGDVPTLTVNDGRLVIEGSLATPNA